MQISSSTVNIDYISLPLLLNSSQMSLKANMPANYKISFLPLVLEKVIYCEKFNPKEILLSLSFLEYSGQQKLMVFDDNFLIKKLTMKLFLKIFSTILVFRSWKSKSEEKLRITNQCNLPEKSVIIKNISRVNFSNLWLIFHVVEVVVEVKVKIWITWDFLCVISRKDDDCGDTLGVKIIRRVKSRVYESLDQKSYETVYVFAIKFIIRE